jgi:hypothetical protein
MERKQGIFFKKIWAKNRKKVMYKKAFLVACCTLGQKGVFQRLADFVLKCFVC